MYKKMRLFFLFDCIFFQKKELTVNSFFEVLFIF
jgi:hypothetical protein